MERMSCENIGRILNYQYGKGKIKVIEEQQSKGLCLYCADGVKLRLRGKCVCVQGSDKNLFSLNRKREETDTDTQTDQIHDYIFADNRKSER